MGIILIILTIFVFTAITYIGLQFIFEKWNTCKGCQHLHDKRCIYKENFDNVKCNNFKPIKK